MNIRLLVICAIMFALPAFAHDSLSDLASEFWSWRATTQPFNLDDIPRIERPAGVVEFEQMEKNRNRNVPALKLSPSLQAEIKQETADARDVSRSSH
jgi:hypothetical protein